MPGYSSSPACSLARKLSWISCLTVFDCQPLSRSSASVEGFVDIVDAMNEPSDRVFIAENRIPDYSAGGQGRAGSRHIEAVVGE